MKKQLLCRHRVILFFRYMIEERYFIVFTIEIYGKKESTSKTIKNIILTFLTQMTSPGYINYFIDSTIM